MTAQRHDHFSGNGLSPGGTTQSLAGVQAQEGTPPVSPWLVEHLEGRFGGYAPVGTPQSLDELVSLGSRHSVAVGHQEVLNYLKRLLEEQLSPQTRT